MSSQSTLRLASPAHYRICVQGVIQSNCVDNFTSHWRIEVVHDHASTLSTLTGRVIDQAELMGMINQLYGYGLPLVSVECLGSEGPKGGAQ